MMRLMTQYTIDCERHWWVTSAKSPPHVVKRDIHSFHPELDCAGTTASSPLLATRSARQVPRTASGLSAAGHGRWCHVTVVA